MRSSGVPMNFSFQKHKNYYFFIIFYWLQYMSQAMFFPYIGLYYQEIGNSIVQIGILSALGPIVTILVQPFWGYLSDKARYRRTVLQIAMTGTLLAAVLYPLNTTFAYVFGITALFWIFYSPLIPMEDAIALEYTGKNHYQFAPIRLAGTLGYAVTALFSSKLIGANTSNLFFTFNIFLLISILFSFVLPRTEGQYVKEKSQKVWSYFLKGDILFVFIFSFLIYIAMGYHLTFTSVYMRELGASNDQIAMLMSIAAFSEVPVLIGIDKAIRKFGTQNVLLFGGLMMGIRMILFSQAHGFGILLAAQLMQGITYICFYYSAMILVNQKIPAQYASTGQAILALVTGGLGRIIGNIGGGYISSFVGLRGSYSIFSVVLTVISLLSAAYFILQARHHTTIGHSS